MADVAAELTDDVPAQKPKRSSWPAMKIAHAQGHMLALRSRVQVWVATQPVGIDVKIHDDRLGASWKLTVRAEPPLNEWSLLVGDCVHQLRSALDACIWDLVTASGVTPKNPQRIQFPIGYDAAKWPDVVNDRLAGLPDDITERVRSVQPFNREEAERQNDGLVILQRLNNTDKHQASIGVSVAMHQSSHEVSVKFATEEASERNTPPNVAFGSQAFVNGATLAELHTIDPIERVDGEWGFVLGLTIDTPIGEQPAFETLENLVGYVSQVLAVVYGPARDKSKSPTGDDDWIDYDPANLDD